MTKKSSDFKQESSSGFSLLMKEARCKIARYEETADRLKKEQMQLIELRCSKYQKIQEQLTRKEVKSQTTSSRQSSASFFPGVTKSDLNQELKNILLSKSQKENISKLQVNLQISLTRLEAAKKPFEDSVLKIVDWQEIAKKFNKTLEDFSIVSIDVDADEKSTDKLLTEINKFQETAGQFKAGCEQHLDGLSEPLKNLYNCFEQYIKELSSMKEALSVGIFVENPERVQSTIGAEL